MEREEIITIMNIGLGMLSFDSEFGDEAGNLHDLIQDSTYSPEEILDRKCLQEDINSMMKQLEKMEKIEYV